METSSGLDLMDGFVSGAIPLNGYSLDRLLSKSALYRGYWGKLRLLKYTITDRYFNPYSNKFSYSELNPKFMREFLVIGHPFGITLSVDQIGSDCQIGQNATIGTSGKMQGFDSGTAGFKPKLGFCVKVNAGAIVSGPISLGSFSIVSGGAIVTKDVPPFSIVYKCNEVAPLQDHHCKTFLHMLHQRLVVYRGTQGGVLLKGGKLLASRTYSEVQRCFRDEYTAGTLQKSHLDFFANVKRLMSAE